MTMARDRLHERKKKRRVSPYTIEITSYGNDQRSDLHRNFTSPLHPRHCNNSTRNINDEWCVSPLQLPLCYLPLFDLLCTPLPPPPHHALRGFLGSCRCVCPLLCTTQVYAEGLSISLSFWCTISWQHIWDQLLQVCLLSFTLHPTSIMHTYATLFTNNPSDTQTLLKSGINN